MSRTVTGAMQAAAEAVPAEPILLWEGEFDSATTRLWSGYGPLSWDGKIWDGGGDLVSVDPAPETVRILAAGATFRLNGVPADTIAVALGEDYQGRPCSLWLGMLSAGAVVADPVKVFSGRMDVMDIEEDGDTAGISMTAENHLADLNRAPARHYTDEDQKATYADDEGLSFVAAIQEREVIWK